MNRLPAALVLTVLAAAGLTACGAEDGPDPAAGNGLAALTSTEIIAKARVAGEDASSVRMRYRLATESINAAAAVAVDRSGHCAVDVTGSDPILDGGRSPVTGVHLLVDGQGTWVKMDTVFGGDSPSDRWTTGVDSAKDLIEYCDMGFRTMSQLDRMTAGGRSGEWVKEGTTLVGGVPAVVLRNRTGDPAEELALDYDASDAMRIAVAAEGEPYLLRVQFGGGGSSGSMLLRDFGAPVTVTPPPADQVVHLDEKESGKTGGTADGEAGRGDEDEEESADF
ncbi:hypothetical protein KCH_31620 [Kitasatospora cheerisanensis KCTC 2395]|uniref:Lipoprotein n=1 Tax=Kitasatospora cheerisanensis KCTC 2395 TaxID=1348663 RepID=A0A066YU35_9ACTN|nr:hypothetical protein KCH_31620 [Kitasatospora cheerisanensis KCTC 2395]